MLTKRYKNFLFFKLFLGYRHLPLLNNEGDPIENSTLFVHIAITNRRGGGVLLFICYLIYFLESKKTWNVSET